MINGKPLRSTALEEGCMCVSETERENLDTYYQFFLLITYTW